MKKTPMGRTQLICRYAVCLALMVVCAQVAIPLPFTPVPVTLATFMIFVIGGILGPVHGGLCVIVYILMGLVGLPVFAGFNSFAALAGPTGGYIVGYVPMAAITGLFVKKSTHSGLNLIGMTIGLIVLYALGALWYMVYAHVSFGASLLATVVPFIFADVSKMFLAHILVLRLAKISNRIA